MNTVILDANLLVLLIVGGVDRANVERHKRTRSFTVDDFEQLVYSLSKFRHVRICPNVVTEASNLLDLKQGLDGRYAQMLQAMVEKFAEHNVWSSVAMRRPEYAWLGLTDSVLLSLASGGGTLLTVDDRLYAAAVAANFEAIHFGYLRLGAH